MELNKLRASAHYVYKLELDNTKGEEWGVMLKGPTSPEYNLAKREVELRTIQRSAEQKLTVVPEMQTREGAEFFHEHGALRNMDIVMNCVVDWYGMNEGGKPLPFTKPNLKMVLDMAPGLLDAIIGAIDNQANFMRGSPKA